MASATAPRRPRSDWRRHGREWCPVPSEPLPAREAGRDVVIALLNGPGGPRHELKTAWDDRRETSLKAVLRALWRLGHGNKSAAFATTFEQLINALMPVMGWRHPKQLLRAIKRCPHQNDEDDDL